MVCYFGREIYTIDAVLRTLKLAGYELTADDLLRISREALKAKYGFKIREGFDFKKLGIPKRVLDQPFLSVWCQKDSCWKPFNLLK